MSKTSPNDSEIDRFLANMRRDYPEHMRRYIDMLERAIAENPDIYYSSKRGARYLEAIPLCANSMIDIIAENSDWPEIREQSFLDVQLEEDFRLNAFLELEPPYHVIISTTLYALIQRISEALIAGLHITYEDGATGVPPQGKVLSQEDVATEIGLLLDYFWKHRKVVEKTGVIGNLRQSPIAELYFYGIMAAVVGHEFGHFVVNEARRRGDDSGTRPYRDHAEALLKSNAQQLLYTPMHDPENLSGLGTLDQAETRQVAERWIEEMTADLVGVDLARTYHREFGPKKDAPGIVGVMNNAIHQYFIGQVMTRLYLNRRDPKKYLLTSKTHPPIDFRTHCVLTWIYDDLQHKSLLTFINYCQGISDRVLASADAAGGYAGATGDPTTDP